MLVSDAVDAYLNSSEFNDLANVTKVDYRSYLLNPPWIVVDTAPTLPDSPVAAQQLCDEVRNTSGLHSAHHFRRAWSTMYAYHIRMGNINFNPFSHVKLPTAPERDTVWDLSHVETMRQAVFNHDLSLRIRAACAIGYVAYATAQRVGDIMALRPSDIGLGRVKLQQSKRGAYVSVPINKTTEHVIQVSERNFSDGVFVFGSWPKPAVLSNAFGRAKKLLSLPNEYQLRDLRRTRIVEMYDKGCTDPEVMSFSGHTNPTSLKPYRKIWGRDNSPIADAAWAKLDGE